MPSRNTLKTYIENGYYHVYNRGVDKQIIFRDKQDYAVFLNLFKRYLSKLPVKDNKGREYPWLKNEIELLVFCLMPNHFHLVLFQVQPDAITRLLRAVCTTYTGYFNARHNRVGPLYQGRFKASLIDSDRYLQHVSRYVHLNPKNYLDWPYSSIDYYFGKRNADWLNTELVLGMFDDGEYDKFLADGVGYKKSLDEIRDQLADTSFPRSVLGNKVGG